MVTDDGGDDAVIVSDVLLLKDPKKHEICRVKVYVLPAFVSYVTVVRFFFWFFFAICSG